MRYMVRPGARGYDVYRSPSGETVLSGWDERQAFNWAGELNEQLGNGEWGAERERQRLERIGARLHRRQSEE